VTAPGEARLFLVLGRSRTGSNMLVDLLNQHPEITCAGEIFRTVEDGGWRSTLATLRSRPTRWSGFKMFYYHASGSHGEELWAHLAEDDALPVIHLKRHNVLRTAVSREQAVQNSQWVARGENQPVREKHPVTLAPDALEQDFRRTRAHEARFAERFAGHPYVEVEYEGLASAPVTTMGRVTHLLGLGPAPDLKVVTKRQNPEPLPQLLANYADLKERFAGTEWASFFAD